MSIHAQLSPEALAELRKQERKSKILSGVISCLVILLISGILALFAIPMMLVETPTIVTYAAEHQDTQDVQEKQVVQQSQRPPSAPAQNMAKVIAAATASPTAIPVPDVVATEPSVHFGDDIDFGQGWDDGFELGAAAGGFGSTDRSAGGLEGFLYDLKQDGQGKARTDWRHDSGFIGPLLELQRSGFAANKLRQHFQSPVPLYLTRFALPNTNANRGPELFQAAEHVQPRGWFALYRGQVVVPRDGRFRFAGRADDYLYVGVDGKDALHAHWPRIHGRLSTDWKTPEQPENPLNAPYGRMSLVYGDWLDLRRGQIINVDVGVGENPGGQLWFILLIEEEGVEYSKDRSGRNILPLFTTRVLLPDCVEEIKKDFRNFPIEFDLEKVPVFAIPR